jgi:hypothetical protein
MKNKIVTLSNGVSCLESQAEYFNSIIKEDGDYQKANEKSAPFSIGEEVYIKKINLNNREGCLPVKFINKKLKVIGCYKIKCDSDVWDIELDGCEYFLTQDCISRINPY